MTSSSQPNGGRFVTFAAFTVPGDPQPKQRPRFGNGHTYTPEATRSYEEQVGWAFRQAVVGTNEAFGPHIDDQRLTVRAYFRKGKSADLDNVIKVISDALNGLAYMDDRSIVIIHGEMYRGDPEPRVEVEVSYFERALTSAAGRTN